MATHLSYLFLLFMTFCLSAQNVNFDKTDEGILIKEGEDKVLFYNIKTQSLNGKVSRANYIHPLYGLDGTELTEDFPADHIHHRGIFWAWHQVVIGEHHIGDMWECKDFEWEVDLLGTKYEADTSLSLFLQSKWKSPLWKKGDQKVPFLLEQTHVRIYPRVANYRVVDISISLQALEFDLKIGGSKDEKGYGGFSVRMRLPEDIQFYSEKEMLTPVNGQLIAGPWVRISGSLGHKDKSAGLIIMNHPDNPMNNSWILRKNGSMQNAVFPGEKSITVSRDIPTTLQYRVVIFDGQLSERSISEIYDKIKS